MKNKPFLIIYNKNYVNFKYEFPIYTNINIMIFSMTISDIML